MQSYVGPVDFQVSFYLRDEQGAWHWHYLAHDDDSWLSASIEFTPEAIRISREGKLEREFSRGVVIEHSPRWEDNDQPATSAVVDVSSAHNRRFHF